VPEMFQLQMTFPNIGWHSSCGTCLIFLRFDTQEGSLLLSGLPRRGGPRNP